VPSQGRACWNASRTINLPNCLSFSWQAFEYAYTQLARGAAPGESLLERVIRLDSVLVDRPRPPALPDYVDAPPEVRG